MKLDVDVQYVVERCELPEPSDFALWVRTVLQHPLVHWRRMAGGSNEQDCSDGAQLTVRLVDEMESAALNKTYRHRDGATNVLSFPFETPRLLRPPFLGDLLICVPLVRHEAQIQHKRSDAHLAHLVVHGVLHLLGYEHDNDEHAQHMEMLETRVLRELGFPDPYSAV